MCSFLQDGFWELEKTGNLLIDRLFQHVGGWQPWLLGSVHGNLARGRAGNWTSKIRFRNLDATGSNAKPEQRSAWAASEPNESLSIMRRHRFLESPPSSKTPLLRPTSSCFVSRKSKLLGFFLDLRLTPQHACMMCVHGTRAPMCREMRTSLLSGSDR